MAASPVRHPFHQALLPAEGSTLYSSAHESDACGMGAIVHLHGGRSHEILSLALDSVCNMLHRGAVDADMKTGDGSGVLTQLPYPLLRRELKALKARNAPAEDGRLAVGVFFTPDTDAKAPHLLHQLAEKAAGRRGIAVLAWRPVPVDPDQLGSIARKSRPRIEHLLLAAPEDWDALRFERQLYLTRRELEREIRTQGLAGCYIPSFSSRLISYKGLAMPAALRTFYRDLTDPDYTTAIALYHQRFSTNTFPAWPLGQPFRMLCHNGEINTIEGNRNWMASREEFFETPVWGAEIELVKELMQEGESDSASLDHALELLVLSGRSLEHAMCLLVPPAYRNQPQNSPELRAFYQYIRSFAEPWDGPAALVYTDGLKVCASLDRNGLRPSRFKLRDDGLLFIGSEVGTIPMDDARVVAKGRLGPGQMLSADTTTGQLRFDSEIKEEIARSKPYRQWVEQNRVDLSQFTPKGAQSPSEDLTPAQLLAAQLYTGYTKEDLDMVFPPMIKGGQEAVYSMGNDTPLSVLSRQPRTLPTFFKQLFAQVTNPPIDPIRERAVMSLAAGLGPERNLLDETPEHAKILSLESAVLYEHELEAITRRDADGFPSRTLDASWELDEGEAGLLEALDRLCSEAEAAVDAGVKILIVSDRALSERRVPVPSMLAVGAVHTHLIRARKRLRCSLVADSAEARDTHSLACLFGYGATAVCPWLGYSTVRALVAANPADYKDTTPLEAVANYRTAMEKGLLKIMSKMGISVLNSYQGAANFAAIGVASAVIERCFPGTTSQVGGIDFAGIARECLRRHAAAAATGAAIGDYGFNRYKKDGELHSLAPATIKNFHTFVKSGAEADYDRYVSDLLEANPIGLKHLLEFVPAGSGPVPLEEVEPIESIRRRFTTAAMSLGALSPEAHETLAIAMNAIGAKSDSGEGGEDPERFQPYENGEWARSAIKQVASGRFGVTAEYLRNCVEIEIKMAQGAKPGEGGQLPAHKVNGIVARLRRTQPGVQLISPPPHHDIYSIEDLSQLIHDLKEINPKARITVKLVASAGVGTVAAGVAKANADTILISGHEGGTAASPLSSIHHAGLPWELGLAEAQQTLVINDLRGKVLLRTDGGLRTGEDIVKAAILGAEEYNFGTIAMIAMGCVYVRRCHLNDCPVGVATMDPKFRAKFRGRPEQVIHFFNAVAEEVREILANLGVRSLDELIGRPQFLRQRVVPAHPKANSLDLSRLLADPAASLGEAGQSGQGRDAGQSAEPARKWNGGRNEGINPPPLDLEFIEEARAALDHCEAVMIERAVINTNRDLGTRLSGEVVQRYGDHGLAEGTILIRMTGSAGQSLGAFLCSGIDLRLEGEANDYVGKGMTAGQIVVRAPESRGFVPAENQIVGNTCLYGATGGRLFANGRAGERFGVRNSGAVGVVEGLGDHGCEYMTSGLVVVLGPTGVNFGAGMSGGKAFVLDHDGRFSSRCNLELIEVQPLLRAADKDELKHLLEAHASLAGSEAARDLLADWDAHARRFVRVIPKTAAEAERIESQTENAGQPEAVA